MLVVLYVQQRNQIWSFWVFSDPSMAIRDPRKTVSLVRNIGPSMNGERFFFKLNFPQFLFRQRPLFVSAFQLSL